MDTDPALCEIRTGPVSVMWISEFSLQRVKIFVRFIASSITLAFISGRRTGPLPPPDYPRGPPSLLLGWCQGFFLGRIAAHLTAVEM